VTGIGRQKLITAKTNNIIAGPFSGTFDTEVDDNFLNLNPSSASNIAATCADLKQALNFTNQKTHIQAPSFPRHGQG